MLSLLAAFFLPALVTIASVPPVYGFILGFPKQFEPSIVPLTYKFDVLAETLEKATFPSNFHKDPAYASMLVYLNSLESKPSCHQTATASFISDCSTLSDSSRDIDLRYHYASQLAICEFEATGVRYPDECKGLSRKHNGHKRCIERLEERPQWWTTLSNNIQNALMLCKAMGQQVEKDNLLDLYRNVTKGQKQLFKVVDDSLNHVQSLREEQEEYKGAWMGFVDRFYKEVQNLELVFSGFVNKVEENMKGVKELNTVIRKANDDSVVWSEKTLEAWGRAGEAISRASREQHRKLASVVSSIEVMDSLLQATAEKSARSLDEKAETLSMALSNAVLTANELSSLPAVYTALLLTQEALQRSQESLQRSQDAAEARVLNTVAELEQKVNGIASGLLLSTEKVSKALGDADTRLQTMGGMWNKNSMALTLMAFSVALWVGRENWRSAMAIAGLIISCHMWLSANPYVRRVLQRHPWKYEFIGREVMLARTTATGPFLSTDITTILLVLLPVLMVVASVFAAWKGLGALVQRSAQDEKLPC